MPLKTSYFNKGIFKNNIKRFWLISFAYTFFLFLFVVGYLFSELGWLSNLNDMDVAERMEIIDSLGREIFYRSDYAIYLGLFPLITALAVFSYMHYPKNTAMVHSLPLTRSTLFVTNYLSGLFLVTLPLVLNSLVLIITEMVAGFPNISYALIWVGINLILTFLLYNFAVLAGMFTGHMAAQAIFFYIFNFLSIFLEIVFVSILNNFLFGYASDNWFTKSLVFSPLRNLKYLYRGFYTGEGDIGALVGYVIAGIIFLVLSYYLYKKRHMEVATDVISFSFVKPIFKYSVAFCSAALIGGIIITIFNFEKSLAGFIIAFLIGGFIGYFASEMLMRKTFKVFRLYKGFIVFGLVLSLLLCSIEFDFFGYERRIPQNSEIEVLFLNRYANEATRIALMPEEYDPEAHYYLFATDEKGYSIKDDFYKRQIKNLSNEDIKELRSITPGVFEDYEVISKVREIHSFIINNKKLFEENEKNRYMNMYTEMDFKYRNLYFAYRLKDGSLIEREYPLLTYMDNPELDNLIREYLAIPGVMQSYEPILTKNAGDTRGIYIEFQTNDGEYHNIQINDNIQEFLDNYKKDILSSDPLNVLYGGNKYENHRINIRIDYKENSFREESHNAPIYNSYKNTINYLEELGVFKLEDLLTSYYFK